MSMDSYGLDISKSFHRHHHLWDVMLVVAQIAGVRILGVLFSAGRDSTIQMLNWETTCHI
eukprot:686409-Karenia_brevis.AAC.1